MTSVVYNDGTTADSREEDHIIGKPIVNNPDSVAAKFVDLDPEHQLGSTVYGMTFGVNWERGKKNNAFIAEWTPAVFTQDIWFSRQLSYTPKDSSQQTAASKGTSKLHDITWSNHLGSRILEELKSASDETGYLSLSIAFYNYTRPPSEPMFRYGLVVGSIGVGEVDEPLVFPADRVMHYTGRDPPVDLPEDNPCVGAEGWMWTAYFDLHEDHRMTVDFGNSFKLSPRADHLCELSPFYLGMLTATTQSEQNMVEVIAEIPYMEDGWYEKTAGVQDFTLSEVQYNGAAISAIVVVMIANVDEGDDIDGVYPLCPLRLSARKAFSIACAHVLLEEPAYHIRPKDYYIYRMEKDQVQVVDILVTQFGQPSPDTEVHLRDKSPSDPASSGLQYQSFVTSDANGIASFTFTANDIGMPRGDYQLDGQVYLLNYCTDPDTSSCTSPAICYENNGNFISFLVWSDVTYERPYFWDTHIQPIFIQYERLYPVMRDILRLGDYNDVTRPGNIRLLSYSMSLDINHPSYMPVTRDLSPTKREMILEWLNSPEHYKNWDHIDEKNFEIPDFCRYKVYLDEHFHDKSQEYAYDAAEEGEYEYSLLGSDDNLRRFQQLAKPQIEIPEWIREAMEGRCTLRSLKRDLQDALTLEFATIPLYLTAMYSIKDGHNQEVYESIRSVVMQEMVHLAQVANLLISVGGRPIIDHKNHVPQYPGKLPAGVLPGLDVSLKKASPKYIHEVFMIVEFPDEESKSHPEVEKDELTIGKFYRNIRKCMKQLSEEQNIFCHECEDQQLHWPWEMYDKSSTLYKVTDLKTAKKAIKMIVQQGEGASAQDPTYLDTNKIAHFYKFEELACKHHLSAVHEHTYDFEGEDIEFTAEGVWPMRDNPSKEGVPPGTKLYNDARFFHRLYRSLLRKLQEAFDGNPDAIEDTVYIMESLRIHARRLMAAEIPTPPGWPKQTCGPVFDYEWDE